LKFELSAMKTQRGV